jgi:DNA repair exonuclease SbcCD ATPase subunit
MDATLETIGETDGAATPVGLPPASEGPPGERKRIEEQLLALERKRQELERALAIADHPELAEPLRLVEGRLFAVVRVEGKMTEGLSRSEEKRKEALEKKLEAAREKRAQLDAQIAELESELAPLGEARQRAFEVERRAALEQLVAVLGAHEPGFAGAGLEITRLVPDLARLMPELRDVAEVMVARVRG